MVAWSREVRVTRWGEKVKQISEVVKVFEVELFHAGDGDAFRFRLEVLRSINEGSFVGRVYRLETYRVQPTFPQSKGELPDWKSDALIFVADEVFDSGVLRGCSVDEVLAKFQVELSRIFG